MDLFHTYCHACKQKAHCKPFAWQDQQGKWRVRLLCPACWERCKRLQVGGHV